MSAEEALEYINKLNELPNVAQRMMREEVYAGHTNPKTGALQSTIDVRQIGQDLYSIGTSHTNKDGFPYPWVIEYGRREVTPVKAKRLRWMGIEGKPVYAMHSSAVAPDDFVGRTAARLTSYIATL